MTVESRFECPARMANLSQATAFAEAFCATHQVSSVDGLRLALVLEELFTNTVMHGHGGDGAAPLRIGLRVEPSQIILRYEDTAPRFDPLAHLAQAAVRVDEEIADRPAGWLGLRLVVNLASSVSYRREDGLNLLQLTLPRQGRQG